MPANYATLISGTDAADTIENFIDYASIIGGNGDDSIYNYADHVNVNGGNGADSILSYGDFVTIHGGLGADTIETNGTRNFIYGEQDADFVVNYASDSTIQTGLGDDIIRNEGNHVAIDAGNDNDTVENYGNHSTVNGGLGDDYMFNYGADSSVNAGTGNDSVSNQADNVRIDLGAGDDALYNSGARNVILANLGNDSVYNDGDYVSIDAGQGNDSIIARGDYTTIQTGVGDDTVDVQGTGNLVRTDGGTLTARFLDDVDATIAGARANDLVTLSASSTVRSGVVEVSLGAGNDSVYLSQGRELILFGDSDAYDSVWYFDGYDTIRWTSGVINQTLVGPSNVTLTSSRGALTLIDVLGKPITIIDGMGNVEQKTFLPGLAITNTTDHSVVSGGDGNDTIDNSGYGAVINAAAGDDIIYNSARRATLNGGDGSDTIANEGEDVSINGGLGDDSLVNGYVDYVTINAGRGLNTVTNYGSYALINGGDLTDVIWNSGFKVISSGQILTSGQKVTINSGDGDDSIMTSGAQTTVNAGERSDTVSNNGNSAVINGDNGDDIIINRGLYATLNGGAGYDSIVNNGDYAVLYGGAGNDTLVGSDLAVETFRYSEGDDMIINYGREDTIQLASNYTSTSIRGRDFIINTNNGSLTVRNAANMSINVRNISNRTEILNEENDELASLAGSDRNVEQALPSGAMYDTDRRSIIINSAYLAQLDARNYAPTVINIDASKIRAEIEIVGNDNDNSIKASNGGSIIKTGAGNNTLIGGAGSDFFVLSSLSGDNIIENYDDSDVIQLSKGRVLDSSIDGNDVILRLSSGMLTLTGAANNEIHVLESFAEDEDDETDRAIVNASDNRTVSGTAAADTITNSGNYVVIDALGGNDTITSNAPRGYVTINGGAGNDVIRSADHNSYIDAGLGNDTVTGSGSYQTIVGGNGDDVISLTGSHETFDYTNGDGNDVVYGFNGTDHIQLHGIGLSGSSVDGGDVILRLGTSFMTLKGADGGTVSVINSRGEESVLDFTPQDDTTVEDDTTSIEDDTTTVEDDTTSIEEDTTTVEDDTTSIEEDTTTVEEDTTSIEEDTTSIEEDTTSIEEDTTSIEEDTTSTSTDDTTTEGDDTVTPQDVIKKFMASLDSTSLSGSAALDEAIKASTSYSSMQDAIDNFLADVRSADSAMQFLNQKCGIILGNSDTGAITGSDAGGSTVKTKDSIVPEDATLTDYPSSATFNIDGLTVTVPNQSTLTDVQKTIVRDLYNWWIKGALELNEESYGLTFKESGTSVRRINVTFDNTVHAEGQKTLAAVSYTYNASNGKTNTLTLKIPMDYYSDIADDDLNGITGDGYSYLDRTLAHEFTHALMAANVNYFYRLPLFVSEGLAELTHGIDDTRGREIYNLASDPDKLATYLDTSRRSGAETGDYSSGFMFFRWLALQSSNTVESDDTVENDPTFSDDPTYDDTEDDQTLASGLYYSDEVLSVSADYKSKALDLTDYDLDIVTVDAGAVIKTLSITGNDEDNVIIAGSKGGTLDGGAGDDSIVGGDGNDVFYYSDGDDTITNYTQSKDKIKFGAVINSVDFDGDDVLFVTNAGTLTVKDGVSSKIKTVDVTGHSSNLTYDAPLPRGAEYNSSHNTVRFDETFGGTFNANLYSSKIKTLNATKTVNPINIVGNENNNVIKAGSGGSTLDGGAGNDKLYGGDGADTFIYSGGTDYIYKYVEGQDEIVIADGEIDSVKVRGSSVTLYFDEGALTISKAKGKTLTITDAAGDRSDYVFTRSTDEFTGGLLEVPADGSSELDQIVGDKNYAVGSIELDLDDGKAYGGLTKAFKRAAEKLTASKK